MSLERTVRILVVLVLTLAICGSLYASDAGVRAKQATPAASRVLQQVSVPFDRSTVEADFAPALKDIVPVSGQTLNPNATSTAFAADVRNSRLVRINLGTGAVTAFGSGTGGRPFFAGDFAGDGVWYAVSNPDTLYTIDTTTGAFTQLGLITGLPAASNSSGLTWDNSTSTMYFSNQVGGVATLYTLNLTTRVATPIGPIVTGTIIDIACSNTGQIFGILFATTAGPSDSLISINKATGAGTVVGPLGVNVNFAHGLDFDPVTDSLFYPGYIGTGVNNLYKINTSTGAATLLFSLAAGEYDAFAVKGSGTTPPPVNVINESFEGTTFPPTGWIKLSPDGGTGWNRQLNGTTPVPGWQGGAITVPAGGGNAVAFCTWNTGGATSNSQFLVTPRVMNVQATDSLKFWLRWWPNNFADTVEVLISTTTATVPNFTTVVAVLGFAANSTADTGWITRGYRLSNFVSVGSNIYIAFREKVANNIADGASISLDLVRVTGTGTSAPEQISTVPADFRIEQNYPNPFNPSTTIQFSVPGSSSLTLKVYNALGQEVATLADGQFQAGTYSAQWDASGLASGIYFYRMQSGSFSQTKKLVLMK